MNAALLIPPDASYEEWLARRAELSSNAVTASEIAAVMGISPWDSPFNLYWKKLGEIGDDFDNDKLSLRRYMEPWIADRWAADNPHFLMGLGGLWANSQRPWQMATPDRILCDRTQSDMPIETARRRALSLLEIKSSGSYDGWGEDGSDEIPVYYRAQVLWQLDTLDLDDAFVTCFFLHTEKRRDYVIGRDDDDIALMREAALKFLARIERRDPPPIDAHDATRAALKALNPKVEDEDVEVPTVIALDYEAACDAVRHADAAKAEAENRLRAAMGHAKRAVCGGGKVATRSVYEVKEHVRSACTVDKLTPARTPKEAS